MIYACISLITVLLWLLYKIIYRIIIMRNSKPKLAQWLVKTSIKLYLSNKLNVFPFVLLPDITQVI